MPLSQGVFSNHFSFHPFLHLFIQQNFTQCQYMSSSVIHRQILVDRQSNGICTQELECHVKSGIIEVSTRVMGPQMREQWGVGSIRTEN